MVIRTDGGTMLGTGGRREVTCPACGRRVDRSEAHEYDKFGDQSDRRGTVEYLCPDCHVGLNRETRGDLEAILVDINAGSCDDETFLRRYRRVAEGRRGRSRGP